ncbi:hypothetical protein [Pseudomonas turukhanskensis]|nr:hypothetical protein [Pseudomonas turukhanskensis]
MLASVEFDYCTMMTIRSVGLLLALLVVGACDKDPTPPKTPPAPQAPTVTQAPAPVATPSEPAKPEPKPAAVKTAKPFEPLVKSELKPLPEPPAAKPATTPAEKPAVQVRAPQPPDKIQRLQVAKPQTPAQKKASDAVKQAKIDKPKLNLHLPKDAVQKLQPEVAAFGASEPAPNKEETPALLPQMFAEKPGAQSPFEVGGRVITNEHSRDQNKDAGLLDTVDGAELQFKFRH